MAKRTKSRPGARRRSPSNGERKVSKAAKAIQSLPVLDGDTAGIDIGATEIYVAVPVDRDEEPVRCFETFTVDLLEIAKWLKQCGIRRIAMESTGVYWIPLFEILSEQKFELCLVNARHFKNVPGRKTDVQDCQWLQFLHSVGLLRGSYRPDQDVCGLRTLLRYRNELIQFGVSHIQHMQKALEQMNIKLGSVISELTGVTGLRIIDAILSGERDLTKLAKLRDKRVRATEEVLMKSLDGNLRPEHLTTLRMSLGFYRHNQTQIAVLDREIETALNQLPAGIDTAQHPLPPSKKKSTPKKKTNSPAFDLRSHCYRILGVDLTAIDGIDEVTAHMVVTEVGPDFSAFKSSAQFCSWLRLCPNNTVTGGRVLSRKSQKGKNRLAIALRNAAATMHSSQTQLGQYLQRMKAIHGPAPAITATAHKIARIIYRMVTTKQAFDPSMLEQQNLRRKKNKEASIRRQALDLGYQLTPIQPKNCATKTI